MGLDIRKFEQIRKESDMVTSVELVVQINIFRKMEENKSELLHKHLLVKIREYNDSMGSINGSKIRPVKYKDKKGELRPCFLMTETEAMVFASAESNIIKYRVIQFFDNLKKELSVSKASVSHTKITHGKIKSLKAENNLDEKSYMIINRSINDLVVEKFGLEKGTKKKGFNSIQLEFRAVVKEKIIEVITANKTLKFSKAQTRIALGIQKTL